MFLPGSCRNVRRRAALGASFTGPLLASIEVAFLSPVFLVPVVAETLGRCLSARSASSAFTAIKASRFKFRKTDRTVSPGPHIPSWTSRQDMWRKLRIVASANQFRGNLEVENVARIAPTRSALSLQIVRSHPPVHTTLAGDSWLACE